jgi:heptaprenyl diphosphate synthase
VSELRTKALVPEREDYLVAWLAAIAIAVHILESALPSPLPGVKPGLANVVTVVTLILFGWRAAVWVGMLRVFVGSLLVGTFLSPTFVLSLGGAIASLAVLGVANRLAGGSLGALGYCVLGSLAHMAAQVITAYLFFIPHPGLFHLLPVLMTAALIFGIVSGLISAQALDSLKVAKP